MEIIRNDNNNPLSQAEMKASQQFEASDQAGQVLFHPQVADGQPAPNCVAFLEEVGRFGVTILEEPVHRRSRPVVPAPGGRRQAAHRQSPGKDLAGRQGRP